MDTKYIFRSSLLKGGRIIYPELLEIGEDYLTFKRHARFCHRKYYVTIYLKNIVAVESYLKFNGMTLIIRTQERTITCRGLSFRKANHIKQLIEQDKDL